MPYEWLNQTKAPDDSGAFSNGTGTTRLHLWPYRSLPRRGFVWFIGGTALLLGVPLMAVLGTPVLWGLLPFLVLVLAGIWYALNRSYTDGEIVEELTLTPTRITLTRHGPRGRRQHWQANPHWVRVEMHRRGPVPNYLTLHGGDRLVELGAFLSEEERLALRGELNTALSEARAPQRS